MSQAECLAVVGDAADSKDDHAGQHGQDRDDDEELDQGEATLALPSRLSPLLHQFHHVINSLLVSEEAISPPRVSGVEILEADG